jgi:DNA polymerase-3 subunit gamma/tau
LSASGTLEELAGLLQQMAVEQAVPGALPETDPDTALTRELAALLPADETQLLYSFALHGRQELTLAPDTYAGLAMVLLRLLAFAPVAVSGGGGAPSKAGSPASAPSKSAAGSAALARQPVNRTVSAANSRQSTARTSGAREMEPPSWLEEAPPDEAEPLSPPSALRTAAGPAARPLETTPLGDRWVATVAVLTERQSISALVRELAMQAQLVAQHDGAQPVWRLCVERESLRTPALVDKLRGALADALGIAPLQLEVDAGAVTDSPARREAAERDRRQREAEDLIHNDPLVKELLMQFPTARIVPGSIKPHSD